MILFTIKYVKMDIHCSQSKFLNEYFLNIVSSHSVLFKKCILLHSKNKQLEWFSFQLKS